MSLNIIQVEKKLLLPQQLDCKSVSALPINLDNASTARLHDNVGVTYFLVKMFISILTKKGKLSKAQKIMAKISYYIKIKKQSSVFLFIHQAISYVRPFIGLKSQGNLKSNKKPQVIPLSLASSYKLAIRWLIQGAQQRPERTMSLRLYNELNDAYNKKGYALKKKYEWHIRLLSTQLKSYSFKKNKSLKESNSNKG